MFTKQKTSTIFLSLLFLFLLLFSTSCGANTAIEKNASAIDEAEPAETESEIDGQSFKDTCIAFDYATISKNPDENLGENVTLRVKINDITEGDKSDRYTYLYQVSTDDGTGKFHANSLSLYSTKHAIQNTFKEGDVIKVYGTFTGMFSNPATKKNELGISLKSATLTSR